MDLAAAFDARTGKQLWSSPVGAMHTSGFGKGPNATPAVDGDTLYVLGASGDLAALATKNGEERWRINLKDAFGSKQPGFGFAASALVDGKRVILEGGGPEGKSYVALDKKTGEMLWSHGDTADEPGYNSAIAVDVGGKRRYVYIVDTRIVSLDEQGNEIWSHPWPEGETHASPLFVPPDMISASGVEGVGAALFQMKENGGEATVEQLWKSRFMRNHFSSSVLHGEHIYGFDNANLRCISVEDATSQWVKRGLGKGSLIYADGHLIVLSDTGKLVLAEATPEGYKEQGSVQALEGRSWTAPTLAGGMLYLRNGAEIVAYDLDG
jgi:outer membrane protein assembly factor BamB